RTARRRRRGGAVRSGRRPRASAPDEARLALLDEGGQALLRVLAREEPAEVRALATQVLLVSALERGIDRLLRCRKRHGALGGKEPRGLERPLHQLARLVDRVDEAEAERLRGVDGAPAEDQILGDGEPGDARQPLGAAPTRDDPEVDLGLAELCRARREAQVTRERELAAAAKSETVHGRDRWLRHGLEQPARLVAERAPALRLLGLEAAHVLDVGARDEGPVAGAREHDDACAVVAGELLQLVAQRRERLDVERVERLGARDRD